MKVYNVNKTSVWLLFSTPSKNAFYMP